ncbi:hypothetical protein ACFL2Z_01240 [Candidatus Eisenbacteria bacterium]|uniref:Uncharacterized protein n=1 Tax=Eiseniibacteriota bacterium TaxID=2212470 RepID=A0ABV6YN86_UNCEI
MKPKNSSYNSSNSNSEPGSLFMLNCTLFTREEAMQATGTPDTGADLFTRKVDGYLTGLLAAFTKPSNVEHLVPHLADHDIDLFRRLIRSDDATVKYRIYRTQRDFLLLSIGRFDALGENSLPAGPEYRQGNQGQMGRNEGYYHFTFSYRAGEPGTPGELAEVYKQLAMGFQKYSTILTYSAGMYYDLGERLAEAEFYNLTRSTDAAWRKSMLETKRNEFLDAYLVWKKQQDEAARNRMRSIAKDLKSLDPSFNFNPK